MELREILARNLRRRRQELGVSQEDVAAAAQVDRTYVSALERSKYAASIDVLARIAEALEIEAWELLRPVRKSRGAG
ncbi:MAG: helix-turn-helix domain-containing protein [Hyphomonadaceae bacterium]